MKDKKERWLIAQNYEHNWWINFEASLSPEHQIEYYSLWANNLLHDIRDHLQITDTTKILEIGSGAAGIISCLESKVRFGVDPLESLFASIERFKKMRDPNVAYLSAKGEMLPFPDNTFDLVIIDNVLDHCEDPNVTVTEMYRILNLSGIVYLRINTHHVWGYLVRKIMENFVIDQGHPYTFSKSNIIKLFSDNTLKLFHTENEGYFKHWKKDLLSKELRQKLKALLFVNADPFLACFKKE
jgi:ubiquinone/menaquinone biosynthesis C-methylase UbiE